MSIDHISHLEIEVVFNIIFRKTLSVKCARFQHVDLAPYSTLSRLVMNLTRAVKARCSKCLYLCVLLSMMLVLGLAHLLLLCVEIARRLVAIIVNFSVSLRRCVYFEGSSVFWEYHAGFLIYQGSRATSGRITSHRACRELGMYKDSFGSCLSTRLVCFTILCVSNYHCGRLYASCEPLCFEQKSRIC